MIVLYDVVAFAIPYLPRVAVFRFALLPIGLLLSLLGITAAHVVAAEALTHWFYRRYESLAG